MNFEMGSEVNPPEVQGLAELDWPSWSSVFFWVCLGVSIIVVGKITLCNEIALLIMGGL